MPRTPVPPGSDEPVASTVVVENAPTVEETAQRQPESEFRQVSELAVVEAILDHLVAEQNPWDYLHAIMDHEVALDYRHQFYQNFISMVSTRSQSEQDALITAGLSVFKYRAETARKDVEALRATGATKVAISASVLTPDFMAEMVSTPDGVRYLVYYHADGRHEIADSVQVGETIHNPPKSKLIDKGIVKLPTGIEEYDNFGLLFREVKSYISAYLYLGSDDKGRKFKNILAYYIFLTWIYDKFPVVPYLRAHGDWGSGKTRLLQVVGGVAQRAALAGGAMTASSIFRVMERFKPTLIIDEADFSESDLRSDITKILNTGYTEDFPAWRTERGDDDKFGTDAFDCYGPKVLSTRKRFDDQALESRCLSYTMPSGVDVPMHIPLFLAKDEFNPHAQRLRNMLLLWRFRHYRDATANPRERIEGVDTRVNQILLPLLACAENDGMKRGIISHAIAYQETLRADKRASFQGMVALALLKRLRAKPKGSSRVQLKELTESLKQEHPDLKIHSHGVGHCLRHDMDLTVAEAGGMPWITVHEADSARLTKKYYLQPVLESGLVRAADHDNDE